MPPASSPPPDPSRVVCRWTDAHNHLQDPRLGDPAPIIAAMKQAGIGRCIVNATQESDWHQVASLASTYQDFIEPAFGIHPWHAHTACAGWQQRLVDLLSAHPRASLGECGLDSWTSAPTLAIQTSVFAEHLKLAHQMDRPLTIHCLKAWGALFDALAQTPPPRRFLMHSFGGSVETARRLIPLGAFFSFSGYFLHPRKAAQLEVFRKIPTDRILLESDAPDMTPPTEFLTHSLPDDHHHPANLPAVGDALAKVLGLTPVHLAAITRENTQRCFG